MVCAAPIVPKKHLPILKNLLRKLSLTTKHVPFLLSLTAKKSRLVFAVRNAKKRRPLRIFFVWI